MKFKAFTNWCKGLTHVANCDNSQRAGFTLAEVLITLGIIGVVAALTMPSLIENHRKKEVVTKLKAFNSIMGQAFQMSKEENGDWATWDSSNDIYKWDGTLTGNAQLEWLKKYVLPYIKTTEVSSIDQYAVVGLPNGTGFSNYNKHYFFCLKFKDCKEITETWNSRDRFIFQFTPDEGFHPYTDRNDFTSREDIMNNPRGAHACNKTKGTGLCAKLIEYDGWEIRKDYPW